MGMREGAVSRETKRKRLKNNLRSSTIEGVGYLFAQTNPSQGVDDMLLKFGFRKLSTYSQEMGHRVTNWGLNLIEYHRKLKRNKARADARRKASRKK